MALSVTCPGCDSVYPVSESLVGKTIKCKKCGEQMKVPAARPATVGSRRPADDDATAPRKPARRRDDDDDYDDAPRKGKAAAKKGGLPVLPLAIGAVLLIGGGVGGYFAFSGGDKDKEKETATAAPDANPNKPIAIAKADPGTGAAEVKTPAPTAKTGDEAKKDEAKAEEPKPAEAKKDNEPKKPDEAKKPDDPKAPGTTPPVPPGSQGPGGQYMDHRDYMSGKMNRLVLDKVKRAAVMFRVETQTGGSEGSGWFGSVSGETGLVFTNAHVINMLAPNAKRPMKMTLFLNTDTDEQKEIKDAQVQILAVDNDLDLAILRVINVQNLPVPLEIRPSANLVEGQGLSTIGYPFGTGGGISGKPPPVAVRPTTFTRSLKDPFGRTRRIQVEGGIYTGNSGGPIVDAEGAVMGVVVEVKIDRLGGGQSQLGMGVPTEYVLGLVAGRVADVEYGVPYKDGGKVKIPVKAKCLDPLGRLQSVGVASWIGDVPKKGDPNSFRKESRDPPKLSGGESDLTETKLTYDPKTKTASGEVVMPMPPAGRTYWAQAFYSNLITPKYYLPGFAVATDGPPVDRAPATLQVRMREGAVRSVTMSNSIAKGVTDEDSDERDAAPVAEEVTLKVKEAVMAPITSDAQQAARLRLQVEDVKLAAERSSDGMRMDRVLPKDLMDTIAALFRQTAAIGFVNKAGEMYRYVFDTTGLSGSPSARTTFARIGSEALEALRVTSIPIPNREVKPGETWTTQKEGREAVGFIVERRGPGSGSDGEGPGGPGGPGPRGPGGPGGSNSPFEIRVKEYKYTDDMTLTFVGTRDRGGKKEAVIKIEGKCVQAKGTKETVNGEIKGYAYVELDTGVVVKADIKKEFEIDASGGGRVRKVVSKNRYQLTRGSAN